MKCGIDGTVVVARVTSDVLDENIDLLAAETVFVVEHQPQVASVDVAINGAKHLVTVLAFSDWHGGKAVGKFGGANVASVPYFVAFSKVFLKAVVPVTMCV